jgi:hypothetical protein
MQYKTIVLELIQRQPELHERLRESRTLLATMDRHALDLQARHEAWMEHLGRAKPDSDRRQISAEALELALQDLEADLPSASRADEDGPSLDGAMAYLRRHTPTA